ncbi:hypothetical protein BFJ70_g13780 [Fusarium oxysporum]|nr:hypothetical protein BFJ70_g13780 [Fusarium oxysporum]
MIQTLHQSVLLFALEHSTTVLNQVRMISTMLTELNMQNAVWKCRYNCHDKRATNPHSPRAPDEPK